MPPRTTNDSTGGFGQNPTPFHALKFLSALVHEVRLLILAIPMAAYAVTTLWERFGY
jgi:hypothetical protein